MIVVARLVKRVTDDGLMSISEQIELGREYRILLDSRAMKMGYNYLKGQVWEREMVQDVNGGWLPTELLEWTSK